MDNKVLEDIKNYARERLQAAYGFVGVAESPKMVMLNSGEGTEDLIVKIEIKD